MWIMSYIDQVYLYEKLVKIEDSKSFLISDNSSSLLILILLGCIVAPLVEELIFRGVIVGFLSKWKLILAVLTSAILFGFAHGSIQFVNTFVGGLFYGLLCLKYRSFLASACAHAINNLILILSANIIGNSDTSYFPDGVWLHFQDEYIWYIVMFLLPLPFLIKYFLQLKKEAIPVQE